MEPCLKIDLELKFYFKMRLNLDLKSVSKDACVRSMGKLFYK